MSALRDLTPLLKPRSVAVIGATHDANRIGGRPFASLRRFGFPGPVYPVNPRYEAIDGVPCFSRVQDIPEPPDMAVLAIPAAATLEALRDCQAAGVPALTIYTSGFRETGAEGKAMEEELRATAETHGTLICGPNCQGVANLLDRMQANFSSALSDPGILGGPVGFVSQSGLFTGILAAAFQARGIGIGYLVSTGNEAVVDFSDVLAFMAQDPRIRVVAGYLEGVRDGQKLKAAIRTAREHGKPVVLLKVGRTHEGASAAASHTGALAGAYDVYRAALAQWGAVEVDTIDELFDAVEGFAVSRGTATGDRIGIMSNSGGLGVFGADQVRAHGMRMAELGDTTVEAIRARSLPFASSTNPVDFALQGLSDPDAVGSHLGHIAADADVDVTLAFFGVQKLHVDNIIDRIDAANRLNDKPLLVAWMLGDPAAPAAFRERQIPCFADPASSVRAARALVAHATWTRQSSTERAPQQHPAAAQLIEAADGVLSEWRARAVIEAAGIPVPPGSLADSADAAVEAADAIGYPVVLKVESDAIAHKSDVGGVFQGLADAAAVREAYARMRRNLEERAPDRVTDMCGVYGQATPGVDLIAGISRDPVFGPVVLVGSGGVFAETLRDTALGLPPLSEATARAMVEKLHGYERLRGARGEPGADIDAVIRALLVLSDLAFACPTLAELDINPLRATREGVTALDALIRVSA